MGALIFQFLHVYLMLRVKSRALFMLSPVLPLSYTPGYNNHPRMCEVVFDSYFFFTFFQSLINLRLFYVFATYILFREKFNQNLLNFYIKLLAFLLSCKCSYILHAKIFGYIYSPVLCDCLSTFCLSPLNYKDLMLMKSILFCYNPCFWC